MKRKFISCLLIVVMVATCVPMVFADALPTHNYCANLLLEELEKNKGRLRIEPYGDFKVPSEFLDALENYPEAFRAGAMGPDIFPEMITGQSIIHAGDENGTSGEWFNLLVDRYLKMPEGANKEKALAFTLGYGVHYAGDVFGHDYVNDYVGGAFPDLSDALSSTSQTEILERHILLEAFIANQVPSYYRSGERIEIDAPISFVQETLINKGYKEYGLVEFLNPILELRSSLKEKADDLKAFKGDVSVENLLKYGFNTNVAGYSERWYQDLDEGLYEFIKANQALGKNLIDEDAGMMDAVEPMTAWVSDYAPQLSPVPDAAIMAIGIKKDIVIEIANAVGLNVIEEKWNQVKSRAFLFAFEGVFGIDLEELVSFFKQPETYMDSDLFPTGYETSSLVLEEIGNFGAIEDTTDVDFDPFYNSLQLSKLILIGSTNLNKIFKNTEFEKSEMIGTFDKVYINMRTHSNSSSAWDTLTFSDNATNGTDDDVFFHLDLKDGRSYRLLMDIPMHDDFEGGYEDTYTIELPESVSYGEVSGIRVEKKNIIDDDWGPDFIRVYPDGGKDIVAKTPIDKYFRGNDTWYYSVNLEEEHNGYSKLDPKIINFVQSLDASSQWQYASFYAKDQDTCKELFRNIGGEVAINQGLKPYIDDFSSSNMQDYNVYGGDWLPTGVGFNDKSQSGRGDKILIKGKSFDNFVVETSLGVGDNYQRSNTPYQDSGLIFRVNNPRSGDAALEGYYYAINGLKDILLIGYFENNQFHEITQIPYAINTYNDRDKDQYQYVLKVVANGPNMTFYADGKEVYSMHDTRFAEGEIGLRQYANVDGMFAFYDYLDVYPMDEDGEIYEENPYSPDQAGFGIINDMNYKVKDYAIGISFKQGTQSYYSTYTGEQLNNLIMARMLKNTAIYDNGSYIYGNFIATREKDADNAAFQLVNDIENISGVQISFNGSVDGNKMSAYKQLDTLSSFYQYRLKVENGQLYLESVY